MVKELKPEIPQLANANTQTPAIENTNISRSLLDTLTQMKENKKFFKLVEKDDVKYFGTKFLLKR